MTEYLPPAGIEWPPSFARNGLLSQHLPDYIPEVYGFENGEPLGLEQLHVPPIEGDSVLQMMHDLPGRVPVLEQAQDEPVLAICHVKNDRQIRLCWHCEDRCREALYEPLHCHGNCALWGLV